MKFLYKIWSGYDGFVPAELPSRISRGGYLRLSWGRYIDAVEQGHSEVWLYFFGRQAFENGVYVKGVADQVDLRHDVVRLRVNEFDTERPLTDAETSAAVAHVVAARGLQVFVLPDYLDVAPDCSMSANALSCAHRYCGSCPTWQALARIKKRQLGWPENLSGDFSAYVPAYWVITNRNVIYRSGRSIKDKYHRTSELFYRFKTGEKRLAFPLALGIRECLADRGLDDFDAVVPVPLTPEKIEAKEINRTRLLAGELARLLDVPRRDWLALSKPTSKHVLQSREGYPPAQYEEKYLRHLQVSSSASDAGRVLVVDDVCTVGNTLNACLRGLKQVNPELEAVAVTAGQMTVKAAIRHISDLAA